MAGKPETTEPPEMWHTVRNARIIWTKSGKFGVRFSTVGGNLVTHYFDAPLYFIQLLERATNADS